MVLTRALFANKMIDNLPDIIWIILINFPIWFSAERRKITEGNWQMLSGPGLVWITFKNTPPLLPEASWSLIITASLLLFLKADNCIFTCRLLSPCSKMSWCRQGHQLSNTLGVCVCKGEETRVSYYYVIMYNHFLKTIVSFLLGLVFLQLCW